MTHVSKGTKDLSFFKVRKKKKHFLLPEEKVSFLDGCVEHVRLALVRITHRDCV